MTRLLAIETSSEACSVALSVGGELSSREYHEPRRHAELLLPAVRELLAEAAITLTDLDAIAFGRGPGSFTSLRIGIGVVQGLAWGAEVGVVPVASLAALALGGARRHGGDRDTTVITAMDARMSEVFHARYRVSAGNQVILCDEEGVSAPAEVDLEPAADLIGAGSGFKRYPDLARRAGSLAAVYADLCPSAVEVAALAEEWLKSKQPLPAHRAQPVYIRDHVAEKPGA